MAETRDDLGFLRRSSLPALRWFRDLQHQLVEYMEGTDRYADDDEFLVRMRRQLEAANQEIAERESAGAQTPHS